MLRNDNRRGSNSDVALNNTVSGAHLMYFVLNALAELTLIPVRPAVDPYAQTAVLVVFGRDPAELLPDTLDDRVGWLPGCSPDKAGLPVVGG